jgi:uridine kinase
VGRQAELADVKNFNFDHPDAFDTPALLECLNGLKQGRPVNVPTYDFSAHRRGTETKRVRVLTCTGLELQPCAEPARADAVSTMGRQT